MVIIYLLLLTTLFGTFEWIDCLLSVFVFFASLVEWKWFTSVFWICVSILCTLDVDRFFWMSTFVCLNFCTRFKPDHSIQSKEDFCRHLHGTQVLLFAIASHGTHCPVQSQKHACGYMLFFSPRHMNLFVYYFTICNTADVLCLQWCVCDVRSNKSCTVRVFYYLLMEFGNSITADHESIHWKLVNNVTQLIVTTIFY